MKRSAEIERNTSETRIRITLCLDGSGSGTADTGIPFFDHMLHLFTRHGFFDLTLAASGDLAVDHHHTVEDVGIVLGRAVSDALSDRSGIRRYGRAETPMDETLAAVSIDLSNRPYLVYNLPIPAGRGASFDTGLAREFLRAFAVHAGLTLHVNVFYGDNEHHILEAVFKALGRALAEAVRIDDRIAGVRSTKGAL